MKKLMNFRYDVNGGVTTVAGSACIEQWANGSRRQIVADVVTG